MEVYLRYLERWLWLIRGSGSWKVETYKKKKPVLCCPCSAIFLGEMDSILFHCQIKKTKQQQNKQTNRKTNKKTEGLHLFSEKRVQETDCCFLPPKSTWRNSRSREKPGSGNDVRTRGAAAEGGAGLSCSCGSKVEDRGFQFPRAGFSVHYFGSVFASSSAQKSGATAWTSQWQGCYIGGCIISAG